MFGVRVSCYKIDMEIKLTAVFRKFPEGYAAFVEELPGANTQGATLEEARASWEEEAVEMVCKANREIGFELNEHDHRNSGSDWPAASE